MKTNIRLFGVLLVILTVTGLTSCNKETGNGPTGTAEFSIALPAGTSQLKSASADSTIVSYQLLISAVDAKGTEILSDKLIPLYAFGSGYLSDKLEIQSGEFKLTKFMVINPSGSVIYAAPLTGSPLAYLTLAPLPLKFNIYAGKVTSVTPEVLAVGDLTPAQFGYASFGVQIIKPLEFYVSCVIESASATVLPQPTTASLTVSNNSGWLYSFSLAASVNKLLIRGGSDVYTFVVVKDGYTSVKLQFTAQQLTATTKDNPLVLKIPYTTPITQIMFFQPGPEEGKDAMISNLDPDKNFGTYKYFEATYMSESVLTVMRSNRSLIFFNLSALPKSANIKKAVLKLFYDIPIPWDSTIFHVANSTALVKAYGVIQQIIEPWDENTVTWNNQPKTTEVNQVFVYPFIRNVNYIEIDVTGLIVIPAANALPNNGMLFKLYPNERFKGFRFASSDYSDPLMRPKLSIQYTQ